MKNGFFLVLVSIVFSLHAKAESFNELVERARPEINRCAKLKRHLTHASNIQANTDVQSEKKTAASDVEIFEKLAKSYCPFAESLADQIIQSKAEIIILAIDLPLSLHRTHSKWSLVKERYLEISRNQIQKDLQAALTLQYVNLTDPRVKSLQKRELSWIRHWEAALELEAPSFRFKDSMGNLETFDTATGERI
jgi:hypothetical protein